MDDTPFRRNASLWQGALGEFLCQTEVVSVSESMCVIEKP